MVAVGERALFRRHQAVAFDLGERRAHARRHRRQTGQVAGFGVGHLYLGHHADGLRSIVLRMGFFEQKKPQEDAG